MSIAFSTDMVDSHIMRAYAFTLNDHNLDTLRVFPFRTLILAHNACIHLTIKSSLWLLTQHTSSPDLRKTAREDSLVHGIQHV